MTTGDLQGLEPVVVVATEFEAQTKAAVLESEGIDCKIITASPAWTGSISLSASFSGAAILVKPQDSQQAKDILKDTAQDSVDLDWDEVDVGEREDSLPLTPEGRMAPLVRIALTIIFLSILVGLLRLIF